jgi:hypothetical protein
MSNYSEILDPRLEKKLKKRPLQKNFKPRLGIKATLTSGAPMWMRASRLVN